MDEAFLAFAERAYQSRRGAEAAWLDARLARVRSGKAAAGAARTSMRRRCRAARNALEEALREHAGSIGNLGPAALATAYDRLAGADQATCVNAVAAVAGRFADAQAAMVATERAVATAFARGRRDALRHLTEDARELQERERDRSRSLPAVAVRRGAAWLFGGGAIWSLGGWVSWHWSTIQSYAHQLQHLLHH
jgi:hypothetical protein